MQKSRIIVTGGSGFLGSWICRGLVEQGHTVRCLDDFSGSDIENVADLIAHSHFSAPQVDCRNLIDLEHQFRKFQPEVVYHLAANARESASFFQPTSVVSRNISTYVNTLMLAIKYKVKRIIIFSSIAAYGHQEPPFTEDMELKPADLYGLSKKYMEEMTRMMADCHGIEYIIFRPHNVFGEGQSLRDPFRNVIAIWMNKIMRNESLVIYGDGNQGRSFSYIENSLPCYLNALDCKPNQTFNIGSDRYLSVYQLCKLVLEAMKMPEGYPIDFLPFRYGEVHAAYSDHSLARNVLGFEDTISLGEGIERMAEWAKGKGPQEWREGDPLELINELTPKNWA